MQFVRFADPNLSMGLAVRLMMDKPAYSRLSFTEWVGVLNGQILRSHYGFVIGPSADGTDMVCGFAGWALTTRENAEAWAKQDAVLSYDDCLVGDAVIFNVWVAETRAVNRYMVNEMRKIFYNNKILYWKRVYGDGTKRLVKLPVNRFVTAHVERQAANLRDCMP